MDKNGFKSYKKGNNKGATIKKDHWDERKMHMQAIEQNRTFQAISRKGRS